MPRRYHRSVIDQTNGCAFIMADDIAPDGLYDIELNGVLVARGVPGQELIDERHRQRDAYLREDPTHTEIAKMDVAELIRRYAIPTH